MTDSIIQDYYIFQYTCSITEAGILKYHTISVLIYLSLQFYQIFTVSISLSMAGHHMNAYNLKEEIDLTHIFKGFSSWPSLAPKQKYGGRA